MYARDKKPYTAKEIEAIRATLTCVVCHGRPRPGSPFAVHTDTCRVPYNYEGGPVAPKLATKRKPRVTQHYAAARPDTPCEHCGGPVKQPWPKRTVKYCSDRCKEAAHKARKRVAA